VKFVDDDGAIIVPKSVRPIIEYSQTALGDRAGALKVFRAGKLHIRDYGSHYSVHSDRIDPRNDPFGHLIVDAPEYLVGLLSGISIYSTLKERAIVKHSRENNAKSTPAADEIEDDKDSLTPYLAGIFAAYTGYSFTKFLKKLGQRRG